MMKYEVTVDDATKLKKAYMSLDRLIELIEEDNRKKDRPHKPSKFITEAHQCLREVLYGE